MRCILLALALLAVAACETVPVTGRSQLLLVSEGEETKMGIDAYQGILKKSKVSSDSRLNEQVMRVGQRIAAATGRNDYQWEFKVLEDAQANAFCLPGGKVAAYTGILPITRDDPGLAATQTALAGNATYGSGWARPRAVARRPRLPVDPSLRGHPGDPDRSLDPGGPRVLPPPLSPPGHPAPNPGWGNQAGCPRGRRNRPLR